MDDYEQLEDYADRAALNDKIPSIDDAFTEEYWHGKRDDMIDLAAEYAEDTLSDEAAQAYMMELDAGNFDRATEIAYDDILG